MIASSKKTISDLEADLASNLNQSMHVNKNEMDLRAKIDELNGKLLKYESIIREDKEQFYLINTENANLKSDLKNLSNIERSLRAEVSGLVQQRHNIEETMQKVKAKISQDSLKMRKYETENEALNRQIMSMENTISIASKELQDIKSENKLITESLNNKERENILLKKTLERKDSELSSSKINLNRLSSLLEAHQSNPEAYSTTEKLSITEPDPYNLSRISSYTPDYSFHKASLQTPVSRSIQNFVSPYASPISSFKRQNQPSQTSHLAQNPKTHSLTPRAATHDSLDPTSSQEFPLKDQHDGILYFYSL